MLISPTGIAPALLLPEHIVAMSLYGQVAQDQLAPSSEWRMHADVYRQKPDINAIVHCHSPYATILACAHKAIPPLHYMVAGAGLRYSPGRIRHFRQRGAVRGQPARPVGLPRLPAVQPRPPG